MLQALLSISCCLRIAGKRTGVQFCHAQALSITLTGVTNSSSDPGVDVMRTVTLPLLKRLGVEEGLELKACPVTKPWKCCSWLLHP